MTYFIGSHFNMTCKVLIKTNNLNKIPLRFIEIHILKHEVYHEVTMFTIYRKKLHTYILFCDNINVVTLIRNEYGFHISKYNKNRNIFQKIYLF